MRKRGSKVYCELSKLKKHLFPTQEKAEQYMKNMILNARTLEGSLPQRVYYCKACGGWHMTSKAHILQQHIDDGSAVINPTPIIIDRIPDKVQKQEERLRDLRSSYEAWEKKCVIVLGLLDSEKYEDAGACLDKLYRNRVNRKLSKIEKRYYTDWWERLTKKTLQLRRRLHNIMCGGRKKEKKHTLIVLQTRKEEIKTTPIKNPLEVIELMKFETRVFLSCFDGKKKMMGRYEMDICCEHIKVSMNRLNNLIRKYRNDVELALSCFSRDADPILSVWNGYNQAGENIRALISSMQETKGQQYTNKLSYCSKCVEKRIEMFG